MNLSQARIFAMAWCVLSVAGLLHARNIGSRFWAGLGLVFALLCSVRATAWNVDLWLWVRGLMQDAGIYGERYWYKAVLSLVLIAGGVWAVRGIARGWRVNSRGTRLSVVSAGFLLFFIAWMTASLDFVLPKWFIAGPVRLGFESLAPLLAAVGLVLDWREYEPWPEEERRRAMPVAEPPPPRPAPGRASSASRAGRRDPREEPVSWI